jgi:hypothetical protein
MRREEFASRASRYSTQTGNDLDNSRNTQKLCLVWHTL